MLSIGFWNAKEGLSGYGPLVYFAQEAAANGASSPPVSDVLLCIAEPGTLTASGLLHALQMVDPNRPWWTNTATSGRFILAGTIAPATVQFRPEAGGAWPCLITKAVNGTLTNFLLWFVHLLSPHGSSNAVVHTVQTGERLRAAVEATELAEAIPRSILIGDFNMRPYDAGMVTPTALNAAPCKHSASQPRTVAGVQYQHFYNPCWELLGNWKPNGPSGSTLGRQPGTFYRNDRTDAVRWWLIDQVLIRPSITHWMHGRPPRILTRVGPYELLTSRGVINRDISDHLPILALVSF